MHANWKSSLSSAFSWIPAPSRGAVPSRGSEEQWTMQPPLRQARQKVALPSFRISWFIHLNQYRQVDVHTHRKAWFRSWCGIFWLKTFLNISKQSQAKKYKKVVLRKILISLSFSKFQRRLSVYQLHWYTEFKHSCKILYWKHTFKLYWENVTAHPRIYKISSHGKR